MRLCFRMMLVGISNLFESMRATIQEADSVLYRMRQADVEGDTSQNVSTTVTTARVSPPPPILLDARLAYT